MWSLHALSLVKMSPLKKFWLVLSMPHAKNDRKPKIKQLLCIALHINSFVFYAEQNEPFKDQFDLEREAQSIKMD